MRVDYHKTFLKKYRKLGTREKMAVNTAIDKFHKNPFDQTLFNHPLKGDKKGCRSISAGYDLRILFSEIDGYVYLFEDVGTHSELYG